MYAINDLRRVVLPVLDLAQDRQAVIDSLPVPVMHFHLVPGSPSVDPAVGVARRKRIGDPGGL
jgi:hypothetical protein